jgi:hypothetical protein
MRFPKPALTLLLGIAAIVASCTNDSVEPARMVIAPKAIEFMAGDSVEQLSITHTCTCPFTWWSSVPANAPWLVFPNSMQGDHADVAVTIDRTKLTADSASCFVRITSNAYGIDSIEVKAYR